MTAPLDSSQAVPVDVTPGAVSAPAPAAIEPGVGPIHVIAGARDRLERSAEQNPAVGAEGVGSAMPIELPQAKQHNLDRRGIDSLPLLAFDADCEQHSALIDVIEDGKSLVIQGPKGSGKTQTAANLIANALMAQRTVLATAPGNDTLGLIKKMLGEAGLAAYALDLRRPETAVDQIAARLRFQPEPPAPLADRRRKLEALKKRLTRYARLMNSGFGELGRSPHEILWALERSRAALESAGAPLPPAPLPGLHRLTNDALDALRSNMQELYVALECYIGETGALGNHPWRGFTPSPRVDPAEFERTGRLREQIASSLIRIAQGAQRINAAIARLRDEAEVALPASAATALDLARLHHGFPVLPDGSAVELLPALSDPAQANVVEPFIDKLQRYGALMSIRREAFCDAEPRGDLAALAEAMECRDDVLTVLEDGTQVGEMVRFAADFSRGARQIDDALQCYGSLCKALAIEIEPSDASIVFLSRVAALSEAVPLQALPLRCPVLGRRDAADALLAARRAAAALRERESALARTFNLIALPDAQALTAAADQILRDGIQAKFSRGRRDARKLVQSVVLTEQQTVFFARPAAEQADLLSQLAMWRRDVQDFAGNPDYREMLGTGFAGLYCDFDKLAELIDWYADLRMTVEDDFGLRGLPGEIDKGIKAAVVRKLMNGSNSELSRLGEAARDAGVRIKPLLAVDRPEARVREWAHVARAIDRAGDALKTLGVRPETRIETAFAALETGDEVNRVAAEIQADREAQALLGDRWRGVETSLDPIVSIARWLRAVRSIAGLPPRVAEWLISPDAPARIATLSEILKEAALGFGETADGRQSLARAGRLDWSDWCGVAQAIDENADDAGTGGLRADETPLSTIRRRAEEASENLDRLADWAAFCRTRESLSDQGLEDFIEALGRLGAGRAQAEMFFEYSLNHHMAGEALRVWPELVEFSRPEFETLRTEFGELDRDVLRLTRITAAAMTARAAKGEEEEIERLKIGLAECRRRDDGLQTLLEEFGPTIQKLTPCVIASQDALASVLWGQVLHFDLLVLDDAGGLRADEADDALRLADTAALLGDPVVARGLPASGSLLAAGAVGFGAARQLTRRYVANAPNMVGMDASAVPDDFQSALATLLGRHGLETIPGVLVGGRPLDLCIRHPERKDLFLLAIEGDGPRYGASRCTRDRDRLDEEALRKLGCFVHRIWSVDWRLNRDIEIKRLLTAIHARLGPRERSAG